ncbi:YesL family protein [Aquibacillus sediminis]|uniref:YesL family protein n=1 Tax=Aquibacillus sediminis TaxID=2574734 RepID=UPI00110857D8|nr:DUF624 domain-containing protein [Aquibacillus sediminis]
MNAMMNGIFKVSEWIMRFSVVNLLWLAFNLPIVLFLLSAMYAKNMAFMFVFLPIIIVAPFLFFPATTAMFAVVRDWMIEREQKSLILAYWNHYVKNYKISMISGTLLSVVWALFIVDFYFFQQYNTLLFFIFLVFGIVLFVFTINFFSVLVHYDIKLANVLKNTFSITFGSPVLSFSILITSFIILYVSINGMAFLLLFFTGSLVAFVSFSAFYRLYIKVTYQS